MSFVYWIRTRHDTNLLTQGYVGITASPVRRRFRQHELSARHRRECAPRLEAALRTHSATDIVVTALCQADRAYCLDLERKLRPVSDIGWNVGCGGHAPATGRPVSDSARLKISLSHQSRTPMTAETKARMSASRMGNTYSLGRKLDDAHRGKLSAALKARPKTAAHIAAARAGVLAGGIKPGALAQQRAAERKTCPHCGVVGTLGGMKRWHFDNCGVKK